MDDVIKSYLISLGYKIDTSSAAKFQAAIKAVNDSVNKSTENMAMSYASASIKIVASFAAIGAGIASLIDQLAQADLGYQKYALRMYMAKDSAKQFKIVTDSMGESLHDIAWIPELNERYKDFMGTAAKMALPEDIGETWKKVRDIRGEFTRLKIESKFALEWIGYNLVKNLVSPIGDAKTAFKGFNDWFVQKVPEWSKKIADWFSAVLDYVSPVGRAIKELGEIFLDFYNSLGPLEKQLLAFGAALAFMLKTGPIGAVTTAMITLIALMDDWFAFLDGRKSVGGEIGVFQVFGAAIDTAIRSMAVALAMGERLWYTLRGEQSPGQKRKLSVVDEIKEVWNGVSGFYGPGGIKEKAENKHKTGAPTPPLSSHSKIDVPSDVTEAAELASKKTGVPAKWIFAQWMHETGDLKNRGARELNNFAGINVPGGKGQDYRKFNSANDFAEYYSNLINSRRYLGAKQATSYEEFARGLGRGGWYTANPNEYVMGMGRHINDYQPLKSSASSGNTIIINGAMDMTPRRLEHVLNTSFAYQR